MKDNIDLVYNAYCCIKTRKGKPFIDIAVDRMLSSPETVSPFLPIAC